MKISRATIVRFVERYNLIPIGACLLLATLLWFHVTGTRTGEVNIKVQLQVKNLADDLVISDMETRYVSVMVKGDREDLKSINRKSISAYVDLARPVIGEPAKYPVRLTTPVLPDEMQFSLYEKSVFLKIEHKVTKNVQVIPLIEGALKGSYLMGNVRVEPRTVAITGPESLVRQFDSVETEVISIKNSQAPVTATAPIKQNNLKGLEVVPASVKVFVPIYNAENIVRCGRRSGCAIFLKDLKQTLMSKRFPPMCG
jgi:YbbR domain-containing protein